MMDVIQQNLLKKKKNHLKGKKNDASQKYLTLYFNYKIQKFTFYL